MDTATLTAVQAKRWEARTCGRDAQAHGTTDQLDDLGARAAKILRGHVGLSAENQVQRLYQASALYAKCANEAVSPAQMALYDQARAACVAGVAIVQGRDNAAYQAAKHQGSEGWLYHMTQLHGADAADIQAVKDHATYLEDDEDQLAELAYQIHKSLPAHQHDAL